VYAEAVLAAHGECSHKMQIEVLSCDHWSRHDMHTFQPEHERIGSVGEPLTISSCTRWAEAGPAHCASASWSCWLTFPIKVLQLVVGKHSTVGMTPQPIHSPFRDPGRAMLRA
jgi:hypothetical protein